MTGSRSCGAVSDVERIEGGESSLLVTNRHSDAYKVISAFVAAGLKDGHKIFLAMHNNISLDLLSHSLARIAKEPVERPFEDGRLALAHAPDLFMRSGHLDADFARAQVDDLLSTSAGQGFPAARILSDLGWARDYGVVDELARFERQQNACLPGTCFKMDVCYAEDFTEEPLRELLLSYDHLFFQNGTVSISFQRSELHGNERLLHLLIGALTDTGALIRANRDAAFLSRLAAETAYKSNRDQIAATVLELVGSYLKADFSVMRLVDAPRYDAEAFISARGVDTADVVQLSEQVEAAILERNVILSEPSLVRRPHVLFEAMPLEDIRTLIIVPLLADAVYRGFILVGSAKPSFGQDFQLDLLMSLARTTMAAYSRHFEMTRAWTAKGGNFDRLRAAGEMAAGVAHGFNNSLSAISSYAQVIASENDIGAAREMAEKIRLGVTDAAAIVRRIQAFITDLPDERSTISIADLAAQAVDLTRPRWQTQAAARGRPIRLETAFASQGLVEVDVATLREAICNLIINACEALPEGGRITVRTYSDDDYECLAVSDTGAGVRQTMRERLFDSFASSKGPEGHMGLGLAQVKMGAEAAGGTVELAADEAAGATFVLKLPRARDRRPNGDAKSGRDSPRSTFELAGRSVLVVDDDALVLDSLSRLIRAGGGLVTAATSAEQALGALDERAYDLVITDLVLPNRSGIALAKEVRSRQPKARIVVLTGWIDREIDHEGEGVVDLVLRKPVTTASLLRAASLLT